MNLTFDAATLAAGLQSYTFDGRVRTRRHLNPWEYRGDSDGVTVQFRLPPAAVTAAALSAPGTWYRRGTRGLAVRHGATDLTPVTVDEFAAALGVALRQLPECPEAGYHYEQALRLAAHGGDGLLEYAGSVFGEYRLRFETVPSSAVPAAERGPARSAVELRRESRARWRAIEEDTAAWLVRLWLELDEDGAPVMPAEIYDDMLDVAEDTVDVFLSADCDPDDAEWLDQRYEYEVAAPPRVALPGPRVFARVARRLLVGRVSRGTRYVLPQLVEQADDDVAAAPAGVEANFEPVEAVEAGRKFASSDSEQSATPVPTPFREALADLETAMEDRYDHRTAPGTDYAVDGETGRVREASAIDSGRREQCLRTA